MFDNVNNITLKYVNTNIKGKFRAYFKVEGSYKDENLDELIILTTEDMQIIKGLENETESYQFLAYIKHLKDTMETKNTKTKLAEIAYQQLIQKKKDTEYFKLMFELVKKNNKPKATSYNSYDSKGRAVNIRI